MKRGSKECNEALENYEAKHYLEKMAIKVLLAKDEDIVDIPGLLDLSDEQLDDISGIIIGIRNKLGIVD